MSRAPSSHAPDLARQRCFNHADAQAAARCPRCRRFYCRKCVTEHRGQVVCAACLSAQAGPPMKRKGLAAVAWTGAGVLGATLAWAFFYWIGGLLLSIPSAFHEGTLWSH